ncbi:MAG: formate/nitrite transporter family protein, partial [Cetobacterium sp.]
MSKMCLDTTECTEAIVKLGIKKVSYPALKVLILGFMGGMFIGLSAIGNLIANQTIGGGLGKIVGSCVFPVGLILVVLVGGSLFTGDCLAYLAWFEGKVD